ncbi:hypothetical protein PIROE2DRAFT_18931 [Piromyces sp. E2]|nr:hypothetical protein PIROE2DRAFT_18931 [Piromyces sp. E2]|eukprot:OUM56464.1 hypothetical protein PIROE2DRAFT_18931 [Piromyces sp. E2]
MYSFLTFQFNSIQILSYSSSGFIIFLREATSDPEKILNDSKDVLRCTINGMELTNTSLLTEKISSLIWVENGILKLSKIILGIGHGNVVLEDSYFENIQMTFTDGIFKFEYCKSRFLNIALTDATYDGGT